MKGYRRVEPPLAGVDNWTERRPRRKTPALPTVSRPDLAIRVQACSDGNDTLVRRP
jgi:hypothetical protein